MKVLVVGGRGQLGRAVEQAFLRHGDSVTVWGHNDQEITDPATAQVVVALQPDLLINCAAWTNVDGAESAPAAAYAANALGPKYLAEGCARCGAAMVQISTNEVFGGDAERIYYEYDQPHPGSVYARSKLAGEIAASRTLAALYVVRVAWLFGPGGNHFAAKMVAAADRHGALRVVNDEVGNPTYTPDMAAALVRLVDTGCYGIYHLTNQGQTSRFGWAQAVLAATGRSHVPLTPISRHEWPRPALPPAHAVLENQAAAALGIVLRPWQAAMVDYLQQENERFALPSQA